VSDEPTPNDGSGATTTAPAVEIDTFSLSDGSVDGIERCGCCFVGCGNGNVWDGKSLMGGLIEKGSVRRKVFFFFCQIDEGADASIF